MSEKHPTENVIPIEGAGSRYMVFFGGIPGPTKFFFSQETMMACGGSKEKLWQSLQQPIGGRLETHRPTVREYKLKDEFIELDESLPPDENGMRAFTLKKEINLVSAVAQNNSQFGEGGGIMFFFEEPLKYLEPIYYRQNLDNVPSPIIELQKILDFEMQRGNSIEIIDYDSKSGELWGIYLTRPIDLKGIKTATNLPSNIKLFGCSENMFCQPETGFLCKETKQFITGPISS